MPKPPSPRHPSKDSLQSVTKKEMEKLFAGQREEMEQLLADQANVILESVDELVEKKMDKKLDEKFNPVITKLDAVLKEFEDHRDEDIAGAAGSAACIASSSSFGVEKGSSMMGARFRTGGAAPFFGFPISELSGNVVELELIWKCEVLALREQLLESDGVDRKFDLLEAYLMDKARSRLEPDRAISAALQTLHSWPVLPLRELASSSSSAIRK